MYRSSSRALRRSLLSVLGATLLAISGVLAPAVATPAPAAGPDPIQWRACADDARSDCAGISVPLDHARPSGDRIVLSVKRYRATGPTADRIGLLFYNPGGPGLSATGSLQGFVDGAGAELAARFDIVAVDPRGVGDSARLTCAQGEPPGVSYTVMPANRAQLKEQMSVLDPWLRSSCLSSGRLLTHLGTVDNARDLDAVRAALGEARASYYGISYGAILGLAYAHLFGPTVRSLVFDGAVDVRAFTTATFRSTSTLWTRLGTPEASSDAFWTALVRCEKIGAERCPQSAEIRERYTFLMDYLRKRSLEIDGYGTFDLSALENTIINLLYHFNEYGVDDYQLMFSQIVALADLANPEQSRRQLPQRVDPAVLSSLARRPALVAGVPRVDMSDRVALVDGIICSETAEPQTRRAMIADATTAERRYPGFGMYWTSSLSACAGWRPANRALAQLVTSRGTNIPLLVLAAEHDPVTGLAGAKATARASTNGWLLTVVHTWGHAVLDRSNCASAAVARFLTSPGKPSITRCAPDEPLFP